jgi:hypothetical protein
MTDGLCGRWSCCSIPAVVVEDLARGLLDQSGSRPQDHRAQRTGKAWEEAGVRASRTYSYRAHH